MNSHRQEVFSIANQAADWLRILQRPEPGDDEAFVRWLQESPLHVREFLLAYRMDQKLGDMDERSEIDIEQLIARITPNVLPIGAHIATPSTTAAARSNAWNWGLSIAASAAFLGVALPTTYFVKGALETYATNVGEQRSFVLDDGSIVYLDTDSRVRERFDKRGRDIHLQNGQALFDVTHDAARPFRVHVGGVVVQAIGTRFDVRRFSDRVKVTVVEGTVQVSTSAEHPNGPATAPAKVTAGHATIVDTSGQIGPLVRIDAEAATAWRKQQLVFEHTPLSQIVAEFNRYNRSPQLRIDDETIAGKRFNGVFDAWHPESLISYLEQQSDALVAERHGDEITIRSRPRS